MNSLEALLALSAAVAISTRAIMSLQPTDQETAVRHPGLIQLHGPGHSVSPTVVPETSLAATKRRSPDQPSTVRGALAVTATTTALH